MAAKRSLLAFLLVLLAACTPSATPSPSPTAAAVATVAPTSAPTATPAPAFPITITDDEGTAVTIPAAPKRIVSLTPATTEILFAIGAGDRVVGKVEDAANNFEGYPPEAKDIPIVAKFSGIDLEKIVDLTPDLVVSGGKGLTQGDAVTQLRAAGIPVIVAYPTKVAGAIDNIRMLGRAVGLTTASDDLADTLQDRMAQLQALAAGAADRPRVFYEIDVTGGIFTPPVDSIYGEMFALANAEQIGGNASYQISLEQLLAADPQVILLGDGAYGVTPEAVAKREGWNTMSAVLAGRIVPVDDIVITRPGPRIAEGLEALIEAIHPELMLTGSPLPTGPAAS
jgi:iron complex transport system substrate-binding protein